MSNSSRRMEEETGFPFLPPCQAGCPLEQDVREYLRLITLGEFGRALEVIRTQNPLPSLCGTICTHPCEDNCRRQKVDEPLSIRALKRAAVEFAPPAESSRRAPGFSGDPAAGFQEKVAVIGAGPAGLTAASDLAQKGCAVTVFEREKQPGGAPRSYIPLYRLPDAAVERDIEALRDFGVEFRTGREFGRDFSLQDLRDEGYKAIIIAAGLPFSRSLSIQGAEHKDVLAAMPFLKAVKLAAPEGGGYNLTGHEVIVIGGGNVAIDTARCAVRCGARMVRLVCLESEQESPAFPPEVEAAKDEGIELYYSWGPASIRIAEERITGLDIIQCTRVFDENRRFNPSFNEQRKSFLSGDTIIVAIGQAADPEILHNAGLPPDSRNHPAFDPVTGRVSPEGVFLCGEIATGPGTAVEAMADGRQTAGTVFAYLKGFLYKTSVAESGPSQTSVREPETGCKEPLPELEADVAAKIKKIPRQDIPSLAPGERSDNFLQVEKGYTMAMSLLEGGRCLSCATGVRYTEAKCSRCLTCLRSCPYGVPRLNDASELSLREHQCQACGLCLTLCPSLALQSQCNASALEWENALESELNALADARGSAPSILILTCGRGAFALPEFKRWISKEKPPNIALIKSPCISAVDTTHLLQAFQKGADGVIIAGCAEDGQNACPFFQTIYWAGQRVSRAGELLEEAGIAKERIVLATLSQEEIACFGQTISKILNRIQKAGIRD